MKAQKITLTLPKDKAEWLKARFDEPNPSQALMNGLLFVLGGFAMSDFIQKEKKKATKRGKR